MGLVLKRGVYGFTALVFAIATSLVSLPQSVSAFAGGDGSEENPYRVANCDQLQNMYSFDDYGLYYNKHFVQTADIDCSAEDDFQILYDNDEYDFRGTFDGQGYKISNVLIQDDDYQGGIFGYAIGATFKNIFLDNIDVLHDANEAGALLGVGANVTVQNVHARNVEVSGNNSVGGLIGRLITGEPGSSSSVTHSSVEGYVLGNGSRVGGLIGFVSAQPETNINIERVYANVLINDNAASAAHIGGLIGLIETNGEVEMGPANVLLQNTHAWVGITATSGDNVGGLVGTLDANGSFETSINISRSYAWTSWTSIVADFTVGGLIGLIQPVDGENNHYYISNNFALANMTPANNMGGFIGANAGGEYTESYRNVFHSDFAGVDLCDSGESLVVNQEDEACIDVYAGEDAEESYFYNNDSSMPFDEWSFGGEGQIWKKRSNTPPVFVGFPDSDGVSSEEEDAAPNGGDANNDGFLDSDQSNVASFVNSVTGKYAVVELGEECDITSVSADAESTSAKDAAYDYHTGLIGFSANCDVESTTVKVYQYDATDDDLVLRKHNPDTNAYFTIDGATFETQTIGGEPVVIATYTIVDNGPLDLDPADGQITDPVGMATLVIGVPNTGLGGGRN